MANLTAANRLGPIGDIQRNFMFELIIPQIGVMTGGLIDSEGFTVRCKEATIPSRGSETIATWFMGTKANFPGKPNVADTLQVTLDETEDQKVQKAIYAWQQRIFDIDPTSGTAGYSQAVNKAGLSTTMMLRAYKYNGQKCDYDMVVYNAWPSERGEISFSMNGSEKVSPNVTFTFDYHLMQKSV